MNMSSLTRSNRLYINTKKYYPAYWAKAPVKIFFLYEYPAKKWHVTLKTFLYKLNILSVLIII